MQEIAVVGGGPAGLTAALYAARAGHSVTVFEREAAGGQILYSPLVENYPGLPKMSGVQFAEALTAQVEELGVETVSADVEKIERDQNGGWLVRTDDGSVSCRAVILAVGSRHRRLGLPGEEELTGAGISYCAVCDGPFYKGRHVIVVGGGNTALQDAVLLSGICSRVTLVHRRKQLRGEARLAEQVRSLENVELLLGYTPEALLRENGMFSGVRLKNTETGQEQTLPGDGMFIAVGQIPGTAPFAGLADFDEAGWFAVGEDCRSSLPGIFVAGDCRAKGVRQLTTAVGDGAAAGVAAVEYLEEHR